MAKKPKKHEDHVDESWLLPYSDLMTLLLALFIVLAASSSTDQAKLDQMSEVFQSFLIGGSGIMEYTAPVSSGKTPESPIMPKDEFKEFMEQNKEAQLKKEMENLKEVKKNIDKFIEEKNLNLSLQTKLTKQGLLITISNLALFESGSAEVKSEGVTLAKEISTLIITNPAREVMVTGHTDNVPISNYKFDSNWELSAIRSINFLKIMLGNKEHDPDNFSAIGYGEHRPISTNKTEDGRKKNRRVEVLVLPNTKDIEKK